MELTWTNILALVLIVHGIGHLGGWWMLGNSWLLTNSLGTTTARALGSILWALAIVGFVGAGLGILGFVGNLALLRVLTIVSVGVSVAVIGLFWPGATWNVPAALVGNGLSLLAIASASLWA